MARSAACPTVAALGRRRAGVTLAAAVLAAAGISFGTTEGSRERMRWSC